MQRKEKTNDNPRESNTVVYDFMNMSNH